MVWLQLGQKGLRQPPGGAAGTAQHQESRAPSGSSRGAWAPWGPVPGGPAPPLSAPNPWASDALWLTVSYSDEDGTRVSICSQEGGSHRSTVLLSPQEATLPTAGRGPRKKCRGGGWSPQTSGGGECLGISEQQGPHSPLDVSAFQENGLGKLDVGVRGHRLCKNPAPSEGPTLGDRQQ